VRTDERLPSNIARLLVGFPFYAWLFIAIVGGVAWAVSRNPAAVALAVCGRIALPDVLTARWLLNSDRRLFRGKLLAAIHCATAGMKLAVSTLIGAFVLDFVLMHAAPAWFVPGAVNVLLGPCVFGHILSILLGIPSVLCALFTGRKVWTSGGMLKAVANDAWPPIAHGGFNWTILFILQYALFSLAVVVAVIYESSFGRIPFWKLGPQPPFELAVFAAASLIVVLATIVGFTLVKRRIVAGAPAECWPDDSAATTF